MAPRRSWIAKFALAVAAPALFLVAMEGGLHLAGYGGNGTLLLSFVASDPMLNVTSDDLHLFWRLEPNRTFELFDFRFDTSELGTRGKLPARDKQDGVFRIVCLGDSTAFGNFTTYPEQLRSILDAALGPGRVEVINAGVPGYSACQGHELFRRQLIEWRPDLVTWCFGFNNIKDPIGGAPDLALARSRDSSGGRLHHFLMQFRVGELLQDFVSGGQRTERMITPGAETMRVTPAEHARLLEETNALCRERGIRFVAITQPHALHPDRLAAVPLDLRAMPEELSRRLDAQNHAVTGACEAGRIPCFDLKSIVDRFDPDKLFADPLPGRDSIHPNPLGLRLYGEEIAGFLLDQELCPAAVAPPDLPRMNRTLTLSSVLPLDTDGDGADELLVVGMIDGRPAIHVVDPRDTVARPLHCDLSVPDAGVSLTQIPLIDGEILVSTSPGEGRGRIDSFHRDGSKGLLQAVQFGSPVSACLRISVHDIEGDGRPEYAVDFGALLSPHYLLLSEDGGPLASLPIPFDAGQGTFFSVRHQEPGEEPLMLTGLNGDRAALLELDSHRAPRIVESLSFGLRTQPCVAARGRFSGEFGSLAVLRGSVLVMRRDGLPSFCFPFGAMDSDLSAPGLAAAVVTSEKGERSAWVASLRGATLERIEVDSRGSRRLPDIVLEGAN